MKDSWTVVVKEFNMGNAFRKVIADIKGGCDLVYVIITFFVFKVATKGKIELDGIRYSINILWQGVETLTLEASDLLGISINSFIRHQALTNCVVNMKFCEMFWLHNCFTLQKQLFLDIKEIRQACLFWKIDSDKEAINFYLQMDYSSTRT